MSVSNGVSKRAGSGSSLPRQMGGFTLKAPDSFNDILRGFLRRHS